MTVVNAAAQHSLARYRSEFPIFERQVYLNSCSLGALSGRSRQKVEGFLETWDQRGAAAWYDVWWDALGDVREGYAALLSAQPSEIALHASVSTATAVIGSTLDFAKRPKIVTTSLDFPTTVYQWLAKKPLGVEVEIVDSPDGVTVPIEHIARAVDDRTALVATSHIYFTTGAIQDIQAVTEVAHAKGALCFIDAYQSVGQLPVDVRTSDVDFLCAGGLKWLLGGPGLVFLYVKRSLHERLVPTVTGWFAHERQFDFDVSSMEYTTDAMRFEQGTPALPAVFAQLGGLEIIHEIGVSRIREVVSELTEDLVGQAAEAGLVVRGASTPQARSAIVMVAHPNPKDAVRRLADAGIVVDARPGHVRISPFFYNISDDHAQAIEALKS